MSKKKPVNMKSAALTGMMVGAAVGIMAKNAITPKKKKVTHSAGKALEAVGEVMQNVSSYLK